MSSNAASVLTKSEISSIRHYVQHKYADLPTERRAEIVADAMQRIVMRQLPDFAEEIKLKLTAELLLQVVARQQKPVGPEHVFQSCLALNLADRAVYEPLHMWTQQRLACSLPLEPFNKLLITAAQATEAAAGEEASAWSLFANQALLLQERSPSTGLEQERAGDIVHLPAAVKPPRVKAMLYALLSALLVMSSLIYGGILLQPAAAPDKPQQKADIQPARSVEVPASNSLPAELRYTELNESRLKQYLHNKSSLLAEQPYYDAIMSAARENNIHPLLLFAITGQEQAFVPTTHKQAKKIANNPFNVFYSWQDYNTTIEQSTAIAVRTILRISKDRPEKEDAITWINREYAEDPNWSKGVRSIMQAMIRYVEIDH